MPTPPSVATRVRRGLVRAALGVSLLCATAGIALNIVIPMQWQNDNQTTVTIVSGSMRPTIGVGDEILIQKKTDETEIEVGDIITFFKIDQGEKYTTHRVVEIIETPKLKQRYFRTQGDANPTPDADSISESSVTGVYVKNLGWLGVAVREAQLPVWQLAAFGPPLLILALLELRNTFRRPARTPATSGTSDPAV